MPESSSTRVRLGEFEADLRTGELFRSGFRVAIQEKPFRILSLLLRNAGQVVTRKAIFEHVWSGTYVQEDQSLNTAIRKVRLALTDSAESPRYIETVGSRGYRFIHPVEWLSEGAQMARDVRLAILPLENLGPDTEASLSDGITLEMISRVGRLNPRVSVIAASSVMRYNPNMDMAGIMDDLAADYVLTGSVCKDGSRVRIATRLLSGADQTCVWSESCESETADILTMQAECADRIVSTTLRLLSPGPVRRDATAAAHEAYLRGRHFCNRRTGPALLKGVEYFEQAIAADPSYALAYVGLADSYVMLAQHGIMQPLAALGKAREAALKALDLDPAASEARAPLAWTKCTLDRDFLGAEVECRTALAANPSYSFAYIVYAFILTIQGRHEESLSVFRRALHVDPVSLPTNAIHASALYHARRYDSAIEQCKECYELDPTFATAYAIHGQALEQKGRLQEAVALYEREAALSPVNPLSWGHLARVHARIGSRKTALQLLDKLLAMRAEKHVPGYFIALVYGALGDTNRTLEWLERGNEERSSWVLFLAVDPKFDEYRSHPRLRMLLQQMGLPILNY